MLARAAVFVLLLVSPALAGEPRAHPRETFDVEAARAALTPEQRANKREFVDAFAESVLDWDGKFCPDEFASIPLEKPPWPEELDPAYWAMNAGWHIGYLPAIRCRLRIDALREEMGIAEAVEKALTVDLPFDSGSEIPGYEPAPPLANRYFDLYFAWLWRAEVGSQLDAVESRVFAEHGRERAEILANAAISKWTDLVLGGAIEAHEWLDKSLGVRSGGP